MNEPYKIVTSGGEAETELKKSRFIAHTCPVKTEEEAQEFVESIRKQYYDARHNCYAYVIGKDRTKVKYSDDGEPQQTAGLPIYNVIKESGVTDVAIVVTRYFGGTLLGAGPLARMYCEASRLGLEASGISTMKYGITAVITADYSNGEKIRRYLEKESIFVVDTKYDSDVSFNIRFDFDRLEGIKKDVVSLTASRVTVEKTGEDWFIE